jgi:hypothetical protein
MGINGDMSMVIWDINKDQKLIKLLNPPIELSFVYQEKFVFVKPKIHPKFSHFCIFPILKIKHIYFTEIFTLPGINVGLYVD